MERFQAYRFELRPNGAQRRAMRRLAGSCRYVYNRALALQKERYGRGEPKLGYAGLCKELTAWRSEAIWVADAPSQALQQALKDLERAYRNFFEKRARFPRFKKRDGATVFVFLRERSSISPMLGSTCPSSDGCATVTAAPCWAR
jgi:putative transposase